MAALPKMSASKPAAAAGAPAVFIKDEAEPRVRHQTLHLYIGKRVRLVCRLYEDPKQPTYGPSQSARQ